MPAEDTPLFELDAVRFVIDERILLHPTSLAVPAARLIGLIGHNGSGKSTLLKLLARQQPASGGELRYAGRPLAAWGGREFARRVAYLPQNPPPTGGLTVRELVRLGRYPWHGALGRFSAADREKVDEAIELVHLAGFADRLVDTLSGGERQRAWLGMLVAQDPDTLLLDEPISALDIAHQIEVLALVRRLSRAKGLGVIVVLHDVNMAARFCDEMLALHSGRLIARGTPAEIMNADTLRAIYGISMEVIRRANDEPVGLPL